VCSARSNKALQFCGTVMKTLSKSLYIFFNFITMIIINLSIQHFSQGWQAMTDFLAPIVSKEKNC
jgi:hypothetical protein